MALFNHRFKESSVFFFDVLERKRGTQSIPYAFLTGVM